MPHECPCNFDKLLGCLACYLVCLYGIQTTLLFCPSCETTVHTLHTSIWIYCNYKLVFILHQIGALLLFLGEVCEYSRDCVLWLFIFTRYFLSALLHVFPFHVHCTYSSVVFCNVLMACILWHLLCLQTKCMGTCILQYPCLCLVLHIKHMYSMVLFSKCTLAMMEDLGFFVVQWNKIGRTVRQRRLRRTCVRGILAGKGQD